MPKITNPFVLRVLEHPYFGHHMTMHLGRERVTFPNGEKAKLFLPDLGCADCNNMRMQEAGAPGSGTEFLQMHHEMIRVLRFLLEHNDPPMRLLAEWRNGQGYVPVDPASGPGYAPPLWDIDDPTRLPQEIVGMFSATDPDFLAKAFEGVKARRSDRRELVLSVDNLGRYIERGIDRKQNPAAEPDGSGLHNTLHEYLGSLERNSAPGAEMNKLRNSVFNEHFWSMHFWIDSQYGILLENCGLRFYTSPLDPAKTDMFTHQAPHGAVNAMSMAS